VEFVAVLRGCCQPFFRDFPPGDFGGSGNIGCAGYSGATTCLNILKLLLFIWLLAHWNPTGCGFFKLVAGKLADI